jgi:sigma-B regulation protein RsbU (phosphoserine phosphatase)
MSAPTSEVDRLERELERQRKVAEASYALHTTLDLDALLGLLVAAARDGVDADRGTVFLLSEDGKQLWSKVLEGEKNLVIKLPVGKGIAGSVASTGETIRISDAHADPRFDASWDRKTGYRTRQILTAPIRSREKKIVGVFQLLNKKSGGDFDADDEGFLEALSIHAALAVENARLHTTAIEKERQDREILLVQSVQRAFQPERTEQEIGPFRVAGMNELCEDASGDYYDLLDLPDGRKAIALGDVSGHGLQAALMMAQARSFLRAFAQTLGGADLPKVMNLLNDCLVQDFTSGKFITLFFGVLDPKAGSLEWVNAGHPAPLLLRASGALEQLEATGRLVGILPDAGYEAGRVVTLGAGDLLVVYTDGCSEAASPEGDLYSEERLQTLLRSLRDRDPAAILDGIRAALLAWTKVPRLKDDLTLLALKRA